MGRKVVHPWYCRSRYACNREHRENFPDLSLPLRIGARQTLLNLDRGAYCVSLSPVKGIVRCGLAGDQRWTDSHLAAAPRGTAASTRFGASSVVTYRHRSPPSLSWSLVISPSFSLFLSLLSLYLSLILSRFYPLYLDQHVHLLVAVRV